MASKEYSAATRTDASIINAFKKIDIELGLDGASTVTISVLAGLQATLSSSIKDIDSHSGIATLVSADAANTQFLRQVMPGKQVDIRVTREYGGDKISVNIADNTDVTAAAKLLILITKNLPGLEVSEVIRKTLGTELHDFYSRREQSLLRLEDLSQKLIEQNEQYRRTLDEQRANESERLTRAHEDFLAKAQAEHEQRLTEVKQKNEQLDAKAKDLDDRANRHARRQIRKEFLEKLASREKVFQLSDATNSKRGAIHGQFWLLLIVALAVVAFGINAVSLAPTDPYAYLKLAIGILGFAATSTYYIRWTDRWFRQHADEEFRLQRLALDFDRASWIVEMALEWKQEKGEEIPHELIESLTANLFLTGTASETLKHPVEDLAAALVGASANLKLNLPGGTELNLDRKGIKSLGQ